MHWEKECTPNIWSPSAQSQQMEVIGHWADCVLCHGFCQILGVCPFSCSSVLLVAAESVFFSAVFLDGRDRKVLQRSVCCGLLCRALCAVHVPRPVRPAVLEKPDSVGCSWLLFEPQLGVHGLLRVTGMRGVFNISFAACPAVCVWLCL